MADFNSIDISNISLPNNLDAEQSVLGAVLLDGEVMATLADKLQPESFYMELHSQLYALLLNMFLSGSRIDIVTVLDQSLRQSIFENQEEAKKYLAKLMEVVPSVSTVDKYAEIVEEKQLTRKLILASKEIYDLASNSGENAQTLLDFAEQKIYDIRSNREIKGLVHISGVVMDKMKELSKLTENEGEDNVTGLKTSFSALDKYIYGLNKGNLILIAARPGMGKTSFVMNIATNVARKYDKKIAVFSLEMSKEEIVGRMISSEASITSEQMKTGKINRQDWERIGVSADILSKMGIYLDDSAAVTAGAIKAKLRRMKNLGLVVIDYLQLMQSNKRTDNRVNEISEITRNLKVIAKELNVPVICLSQLSRGPEQRADKRPMLSDLRESGSIEQDADIVMFLYRNSYYDKTDENQNSCECIIAKNRHGETGTIGIMWDGRFTRFTSADYVHADDR